jgi:hypothetical protein
MLDAQSDGGDEVDIEIESRDTACREGGCKALPGLLGPIRPSKAV